MASGSPTIDEIEQARGKLDYYRAQLAKTKSPDRQERHRRAIERIEQFLAEHAPEAATA